MEGYSEPISNKGKIGGFWMYGHIVYGACICIANVVIFHKYNIHGIFSMIFVTFGIACYFFLFWFENMFTFFEDVFEIFLITFRE